MDQVSIRDRLRYRADALVARGSFSIFVALVLAFVLVFVFAVGVRAALVTFLPDTFAASLGNVVDQIFVVFLEMTDPGSMALDIGSGAVAKLAAVVAGLIGIVMVSALIAIITTGLDRRLGELRKGHSRVIETGHTLILGWNPQRVVEIVRELVIANESEDDAVIVILGDHPKEMMDDHLKLHANDRRSTRVVTRSGNPASPASLELVNISAAKSVIVVSEVTDTAASGAKASADARTMKIILAAAAALGEDTATKVITEIHDASLTGVVRSISPMNVVVIDGSEILARILVQTSRSLGLSTVYGELLSFNGAELYFYGAEWGSATFEEASFRFVDGVPLGISRDDEIRLNPPTGTVLGQGDELIVLASDDSSIEFRQDPVVDPKVLSPRTERLSQAIECELIVGWSSKCPTILTEYEQYVSAGSEITVMVPVPTQALADAVLELNESLSNLTVRLLDADPLDPNTWNEFDVSQFTNVIIVSDGSDASEGDRIDADTIMTLLILRRHLAKLNLESPPKLITELVESQNEDLVVHAGVHDFVVSTRFISMILAQISEEPRIRDVYEQLFRPEGSEIYVKEIGLYFEQPLPEATFGDIMAAVRSRGEVCLGVMRQGAGGSRIESHRFILVPDKTQIFQLDSRDSLVVLAEDET